MTAAEMQALHEAKDAAARDAVEARHYVLALARLITEDWRKGQAPTKFTLGLLAQLVDDHVAADADEVAAVEALVVTNDALCGRVAS